MFVTSFGLKWMQGTMVAGLVISGKQPQHACTILLLFESYNVAVSMSTDRHRVRPDSLIHRAGECNDSFVLGYSRLYRRFCIG